MSLPVGPYRPFAKPPNCRNEGVFRCGDANVYVWTELPLFRTLRVRRARDICSIEQCLDRRKMLKMLAATMTSEPLMIMLAPDCSKTLSDHPAGRAVPREHVLPATAGRQRSRIPILLPASQTTALASVHSIFSTHVLHDIHEARNQNMRGGAANRS